MPEVGGTHRDLKPFFRLLDDVGDGSGTNNAVGDYSSVAKTFKLIPAANEVIVVRHIIVHIGDNAAFAPTNYGGLAARANGYDIKVTASNMANESLIAGDVELITQNDDFLHWGPNALQIVNFTGGVDSLVATLDLINNFGMELVLDGSQGHKIEITLNDSFVGIVDHHFIVHGRV